MNKNNEVKNFNSIFWPILLTFISGRISVQADLIMLAPFGSNALAAFGVPANVMVIDMLIAFSISPVISVYMSQCKSDEETISESKRCLGIGVLFSFLLTTIGLAVYPTIVDLLLDDADASVLAISAVNWMTLCIPFRLMQMISAMILHGTGNGKYLIPFSIGSIALDMLANWFFIYHLDYGFSGAYISTFVVSGLSLVWTWWLIRSKVSNKIYVSLPGLEWVKTFISSMSGEFLRVCSVQLVGFVTLVIFSRGEFAVATMLPVYAVVTVFQSFLFMPIIALMRTTAIYLGKYSEDKRLYTHKVGLKAAGISLIAFVLVLLSAKYLSEYVYKLPESADSWWWTYIAFLALILPLTAYNACQKAYYQNMKEFGKVAKIEITVNWVAFLPIVALGCFLNNAIVTWSGYAVTAILVCLWMYVLRKKELQGSQV